MASTLTGSLFLERLCDGEQHISDVILVEADLSKVHNYSTVIEVLKTFSASRKRNQGITLRNMTSRGLRAPGFCLRGAILDTCTLEELHCPYGDLAYATLHRVRIRGGNLANADFFHVRTEVSCFDDVDMRGVRAEGVEVCGTTLFRVKGVDRFLSSAVHVEDVVVEPRDLELLQRHYDGMPTMTIPTNMRLRSGLRIPSGSIVLNPTGKYLTELVRSG